MIVDIILKNSVIKNKNEGEAAAAPMELTGLSRVGAKQLSSREGSRRNDQVRAVSSTTN